jgi:hypothetical protein
MDFSGDAEEDVGRWISWEVRFKLSDGGDGYIHVLRDGSTVQSYSGRTGGDDHYLKMGLYTQHDHSSKNAASLLSNLHLRRTSAVSESSGCDAGFQSATWTYYQSYPACCPGNPNYDPSAPTDECDDYSGCDYSGDFYYSGHKSFDWVQSNNIIAFFSTHGDNFQFGGRTMRLSAKGQSFEVVVADTCGDDDCDNCCTNNAQPTGYLVDMEYFTVKNNFGGEPDDVFGGKGNICWQLVGGSDAVV